jgi:hypothetical protein
VTGRVVGNVDEAAGDRLVVADDEVVADAVVSDIEPRAERERVDRVAGDDEVMPDRVRCGRAGTKRITRVADG